MSKKRKKKWKGWWCKGDKTQEEYDKIKKNISNGIKAAWNRKTPEEKALYAKHHSRKMRFAYMRKSKEEKQAWTDNIRKGVHAYLDDSNSSIGRERRDYLKYHAQMMVIEREQNIKKNNIKRERKITKQTREAAYLKHAVLKKEREEFVEYAEREPYCGVIHG